MRCRGRTTTGVDGTEHSQREPEEGEERDGGSDGGISVCNLKAARWWMKADDIQVHRDKSILLSYWHSAMTAAGQTLCI